MSRNRLKTYKIECITAEQIAAARRAVAECVRRDGGKIVKQVIHPPSPDAPLGEIRLLAEYPNEEEAN